MDYNQQQKDDDGKFHLPGNYLNVAIHSELELVLCIKMAA